MTQHAKPTNVPQERDFTGGRIHSEPRSFVGTTGEHALDERIMQLAQEISGVNEPSLLAEMVTTAVRISRGAGSVSDLKLMNRALKEQRHANEVFYPYSNVRKVAVFGSARTDPENEEYKTAVEFTKRMRDLGFMTLTGAGPGIMAAGNEGAGRDDSFGLNINLPFESAANEFIAGDPKLIEFNYFFTRKLSFVKESDAAVAFPGGFGTMDEIFEALTLIQTGKATIYPVVLLNAKGNAYWKFWEQFIREHLQRLGMISESDFALFKVTDDLDVATEEITNFYKNFHSYRYVGDKLVIRIRKSPDDKELKILNSNFEDIIKSGRIIKGDPLEEEADEPELKDLERIVFRHRRRNFGRLRQLIDTLNKVEGI